MLKEIPNAKGGILLQETFNYRLVPVYFQSLILKFFQRCLNAFLS
jgi:hypothetical protein